MKRPPMKALKALRLWGCACVVLWAGSMAVAADPPSPEKPPEFSTTTKEPVQLRYKFKTDQVMKVAADMEMKMNISAGGQTMKMGQQMLIEAKVLVTGVDEKGNMSAVTKITRLKLAITGVAKVEYDSDKADDADPAFKAVTAMINVGIPVKISPVGEILETDLEPLRLAARKAGDAAVTKSIEDSTKKMFEGTFVQLSVKPIAAGENYKAGTMVDEKTKVHMSYDILSVSGDKKQVVMVPKVTMEMAPDAFPGGEAKIKSQKVTGWQLFDVEKGYPGDAHMKMHIVFDIKAEGQAAIMDMTALTKVIVTVE